MRHAIIENGIVTNVVIGAVGGAVACGDDVSIGWRFTDGNFRPPEAEFSPQPDTNALATFARDVSWRTRVSGATIGGITVRLDDGAIALINGMAQLAQRRTDRIFQFDSADGPVEFSAAQAIVFAEAVGDWVQLTFDRRAAVLAAIAGGQVTSETEITAAFADVAADWAV